ncbi:MAG: radical SAM (seleno)protein TrsS [Bacteroidales bacterium]
MAGERVLNGTWSVCPICLNRIPAERVLRNNEVYLRKACSLHGSFETIIWRGFQNFEEWADTPAPSLDPNPVCPDKCGLCSHHLQDTCCVILHVTNRCNLDCRYCFADSSANGEDPSLLEIQNSLYRIIETGKTFVQLSGGEPTLRADLPEIIHTAKKAGAKYIQLNTNGIRLGNDRDYVRKLAECGLSFVFLQFDGTTEEINLKIRNRPFLQIKQAAIEHCAEFNLGVTLVPTLVRGVNTGNIGNILDFAINNAPNVRGIHFQPATYMGRVKDHPTNDDRFTLDELIHELTIQSNGRVREIDILPSCCDHPLCGFHGDFVVHQGEMIPLLKREISTTSCCCGPAPVEKNRDFIGRRWQRPEMKNVPGESDHVDLKDMETFLGKVKTHGFTLTAMAFQDPGNIDLTRLRYCSLHVYDKGSMVPFCSHYLQPWK